MRDLVNGDILKEEIRASLQFGDRFVEEAGRILRHYFGKCSPKRKGAFDVVTEADLAVEKHFAQALQHVLPSHDWIGEESIAGGRESIGEFCWVVDPLDGTVNFANQVPFYSFSLALLHRGRPVLGWVLDPVRRELFFADAQCATCNGNRLQMPPNPNAPAGVSTGLVSSRDSTHRLVLEAVLKRYGKVRIYGSQALQLCYVAAGRLCAAVNLEAKIWDDAAGALIVESAGGSYSTLHDRPVFPIKDNSPLITGQPLQSLAGSSALCRQLRSVVANKANSPYVPIEDQECDD